MHAVIRGYGLTLTPLLEGDIELLRNWRNDSEIQNAMIYRDFISKAMQKKWFSNISNNYNFYFIITNKLKKIGMANIKNVDYDQNTGESGILIGDKNYWGTDVAFRTNILISNFAFYKLKLETVTAKVLTSNKKALRYNLKLGYQLLEEDKQSNFIQLVHTREAYEKAAAPVKTLFDKLYPKEILV